MDLGTRHSAQRRCSSHAASGKMGSSRPIISKYILRHWTGLYLSAVTTPGVLFDWALPLLTPGNGKAATAKDLGVRFAALSALRECLAAADEVTLARYATAVCSAVQKLLEDEQTQMQLLTPLLGVVAQVGSRFHATT